MTGVHPATSLLLITALILYWLLPLVAWWMLRGRRDDKARLWFLGAAAYSMATTVFALAIGQRSPVVWAVTFMFGILSALLMIESLRRESQADSRWRVPWMVTLGIVGPFLGMVIAVFHDEYLGRAFFLLYLSGLECVLIRLAWRIKRRFESRAMDILILVFALFLLANLARVGEWLVTGRILPLLSFTLLTNVTVVLNFLHAVFFSFGYWGFALEKARREIESASHQAIEAQAREQAAQYQTSLAQEREQLVSRMGELGKLAQAGALSAAIAHEINQPLASIRLNVESVLAAMGDDEANAGVKKLLSRAAEENLRAAEIIRRIRKLFQTQSAQRELLNVDTIVDRSLNLFQQNASTRDVTIRTRLAAPQPVYLAEGEFEHALINLLNNALDSVGTLNVEKIIELTSEQVGQSTRIWITDNGQGVPPALRESLFDQAISTKSEGMGLGLWLARHIVERHGGRLFLAESPLPGACFVIELPTG